MQVTAPALIASTSDLFSSAVFDKVALRESGQCSQGWRDVAGGLNFFARRCGLVLTPLPLSPEQVHQFDRQNRHHHYLKQERARLVKLADHGFVKFAGGLQLFINQVAVVVDTDLPCRQPVSPCIEHVAEELN